VERDSRVRSCYKNNKETMHILKRSWQLPDQAVLLPQNYSSIWNSQDDFD